MSLWWIGPPAEELSLEEPNAPTDAQRIPRLVRDVASCNFVAVACGGAHVMALTSDGRLFGWGWNAYGQCGLGSVAPIAAPRALGKFVGKTVAAVACGVAHTVALAQEYPGANCSVYAWGAHSAGQLGIEVPSGDELDYDPGAMVDHTSPSLVKSLSNVAGQLAEGGILGMSSLDGLRVSQPISCGLAHSTMISKSGALYSWGCNRHGQCGQMRLSGTIAPSPVHLLAHEAMQEVACGAGHTLALTQKGCVYSFGMNSVGQIGDGSYHHRPCSTPQPVRLPSNIIISSIACGEEFSTCVSKRGEVFTWGFGGNGQLGHGNAGSMRLPRQVACDTCEEVSGGAGHLIARTAKGGVFTLGYPGNWRALKGNENPVDALTSTSTADSFVVAPDWRPRALQLDGQLYQGVTVSGVQVSPLVASHVAAGRFFSIIVGDPIEPMGEDDAASLIQKTFRKDRAVRDELQRRKEEEAAAVITGRSSAFLASRALNSARAAQQAQEREVAAVRMQAQQRRRQEQRIFHARQQELRLKQQQAATVKQEVIFATAKLAPEPKSLRAVPPPAKRTGGGYNRHSPSRRR